VPERGGRRAGRHDAHDGDHRRAARLRACTRRGRRADAASPRPLPRARHARQGAGRPGPGRAHGARLGADESAAGSRAPPGAAAPRARLPRRRRRLVRPRVPPSRHGLRRQADRLRARRGVARGLALAAAAGAVHWGLVPGASLIEQGARHEIDAATYLRVVAAAWAAVGAVGLAGALAAALAARAFGRARWREAALAIAAAVACTTVVVYGLFVPARAAQKSVKPFAHAVRDR